MRSGRGRCAGQRGLMRSEEDGGEKLGEKGRGTWEGREARGWGSPSKRSRTPRIHRRQLLGYSISCRRQGGVSRREMRWV